MFTQETPLWADCPRTNSPHPPSPTSQQPGICTCVRYAVGQKFGGLTIQTQPPAQAQLPNKGILSQLAIVQAQQCDQRPTMWYSGLFSPAHMEGQCGQQSPRCVRAGVDAGSCSSLHSIFDVPGHVQHTRRTGVARCSSYQWLLCMLRATRFHSSCASLCLAHTEGQCRCIKAVVTAYCVCILMYLSDQPAGKAVCPRCAYT